MNSEYDTYDYTKYWTKRTYEHESERLVIDEFLDSLKGKKKIIDIGCGFGRLAQVYERKASEITLVDPSMKLLEIAKKKYSKSKKISYVKSNLELLPKKVKNNYYDLAFCIRVLHHVDNIEEAINSIDKVLDKKGYLVLEFANKLHGKAVFSNFLKGNFTFPLDIDPVDRRSKKNIKNDSILFLNHHPDLVRQVLKEKGFKILEEKSVSNFRSGFFKENLPMSFLLKLEKWSQDILSKFNFGPSIFIIAQKK